MATPVVTGFPIKFGDAKKLRLKAADFANDPEIYAAITPANPNVKPETRIFYTNLDCAFVFDYDSLVSLMDQIRPTAVTSGGLVMIMGASDDPTRMNKPTLSVFPCRITKSVIDGVDTANYSIIHTSDNEDLTMGVEHPGLVKYIPHGEIGRGIITILNS